METTAYTREHVMTSAALNRLGRRLRREWDAWCRDEFDADLPIGSVEQDHGSYTLEFGGPDGTDRHAFQISVGPTKST